MVSSSPTNLSPMFGVVIVRAGMLLSPLRIAIICFLPSWTSVGQLLGRLGNKTVSFPLLLFWNCSVAIALFCGWIPFLSVVTFDLPLQFDACFQVLESFG